MKKIELKVDLGKNSYPIIIGSSLLNNISEYVKKLTSLDYVIIITDDVVANNYLDTVEKSLKNSGISTRTHIVKSGESSKSLTTYNDLIEKILSEGIERNTVLIALGGGVVGDLSGFVASSLLRGIKFIQVPTTLLSQVDSSVGGKTGINSKSGKNLIGAFYQPSMVISDIEVLKTLNQRQLSAGLAEVIKYGLIQDKSFYDYLANTLQSKITDESFIDIVETSCKIKADIVAQDEKEHGKRALLNLGHTFGHSIEKYCGYDDTVLHGEAIAIGMVMAYKLAVKLGSASNDELNKIIELFKIAKLPTNLSDINKDFDKNKLFKYMYKDKKVENGVLKLVLPNGIGDSYTTADINPDDIKQIWDNS